MKIAERIVLIVLPLVLIGLGYGAYYLVQKERADVRAAVARGEYETRSEPSPAEDTSSTTSTADWRAIYPDTVPILIGGVAVDASIADSLSERIKGLSNTPYLPENVVKLFAFGTPGNHSIWMKDMNYAIDIMWVAQTGEIVHIEENVSPKTYPNSFSSPTPAWFVIEAAAGFVETHNIAIGAEVVLPISEAVAG